jgi:hypothetical protein
MAPQKGERCINSSEEGIEAGQLRVHFHSLAQLVALVLRIRTDPRGSDRWRPPIATTIMKRRSAGLTGRRPRLPTDNRFDKKHCV